MPHGTTVLGLKYADGVIMAGDRRATAGYTVADARMRKVFAADDYSAIAIAGAAGQAIEMVKLFQLELEHYEKVTGDRLSLEGKANRLAQMIRSNFPLAMQGLVVVPLFGGFDERRARAGSSTTTPPAGGGRRTTTRPPAPAGSRPKNSLKKRWRAGPGPRRGAARRGGGADRRRRGRRRHRRAGSRCARSSRTRSRSPRRARVDVPEDEIAAAVAAVLEGAS